MFADAIKRTPSHLGGVGAGRGAGSVMEQGGETGGNRTILDTSAQLTVESNGGESDVGGQKGDVAVIHAFRETPTTRDAVFVFLQEILSLNFMTSFVAGFLSCLHWKRRHSPRSEESCCSCEDGFFARIGAIFVWSVTVVEEDYHWQKVKWERRWSERKEAAGTLTEQAADDQKGGGVPHSPPAAAAGRRTPSIEEPADSAANHVERSDTEDMGAYEFCVDNIFYCCAFVPSAVASAKWQRAFLRLKIRGTHIALFL